MYAHMWEGHSFSQSMHCGHGQKGSFGNGEGVKKFSKNIFPRKIEVDFIWQYRRTHRQPSD